MSIANGLFLIIFMQRNGFILKYIFNSITKKYRFINGWFKLKDQSINRCFFVIEVKMYLLKLHSSINKPVLLHEGYEGKAVVPDINASSVWNQKFLGIPT